MHNRLYITRFYTVLGILLLYATAACSQSAVIDSLKARLNKFDREKAAMGSAYPKMRDTLKADMLSSLAIAYSKYNPEMSMQYAEKQLAISKATGYKFGIANAYEMQAYVYEYQGKYNQALTRLKQARAVFLEIGRRRDAINIDNGIGVQYAKQGIYAEALKYLFRALSDVRKEKDYWGIMSTCNNIGLVYTKHKEYDRALQYYSESLNLQLKHSENRGIAYTYMNLGEIYGRKEMYAESEKYFKLGIKSAERIQDNVALANNYCGLGILYTKQESYGKAKQMLEKALGIMNAIDDRGGIFTAYLALGETYFAENDKPKALEYTQKAEAMVTESGELEKYKQVYRQLSEIYAGIGNYKAAFENHKRFKQFNDSVFNAENQQKLTEQRMNYEFKGIQQKKDLAAQQALQKQKDIRNATVGGLTILAIIVIVLLIRRYKKKITGKQEDYARLQEKLTIKEIEAQALKVEKENIALKNSLMAREKEYEMHEKEKLLEKLDFNRRELASATLYLYQKNELLSGLKAKIDALLQGEATTTQISKIKSTIQQNLYMDADWDKFKLHFEQVHPDFFKDLNIKHPGLTAYEIRL
jgi:tetratricopeptide (TPR) repeat protein